MMKTTTVRVAMAAAVMTTVLAAGCGTAVSSPQPSNSPPPASSTSLASPTPPVDTSRPTASTAATARPTAQPTTTPTSVPTVGVAFVEIEPASIIELADLPGAIPIVADGTTVWAAASDGLLKIDAQTNSVKYLDTPPMNDVTSLTLADDGLWVTREDSGRLYRLDPQTGQVLLDVATPNAVHAAVIGNEVWVGREDLESMSAVDRQTGEVGSATISEGAFGVAGVGDLWFTPGLQPKVVRVDPATGSVKASFPVTGESNCQIVGTFPDNAWTACFGADLIQRSATRVDPSTNQAAVVATFPPTHGGAVIAINGQPWFVGSFEDSAGKPFAGLLRIDPATGAIDRFFSVADVDPDYPAVTTDALWFPDEPGHRLVKINLSDLGA